MFENYSSFYTQAPIIEAHYLLDHWLQFHGQMKPIHFLFHDKWSRNQIWS